MSAFYAEEFAKMQAFADAKGVQLTKKLGSGQDGLVYATEAKSALKTLRFSELYRKELAVYQRLQTLGIQQVAGFAVPALLASDDALLTLEMELVTPPFVVDFAAASLDVRSRIFEEFTAEQWETWTAERMDLFGEDWPLALRVLSAFEDLGIFLGDVKPGNITVAN